MLIPRRIFGKGMDMKKVFHGLLFLFLFATTNAAVRINEIAWSGTTESANDEWIELFNDGEESVSLENWTLKATDGNPDILLTGIIEPAGFFLLERTDDTSVPNIPANKIFTGSLSNTGEELILSDETGKEHDRTLPRNWIAGESSPERRSMMRTTDGWQTFAGEANEFGIFGTPGIANEILSPPEPEKTFHSAIPTSVKITEIAPVSIGEPEWFEVEVLADAAVDFTEWKIRKGTQEVDFSSLQITNEGIPLAGQSVALPETGLVKSEQRNGSDFTFAENAFVFLPDDEKKTLRFIGNPSPIGLPDDGGTLEIVNEKDEGVATATWEKTKSGTKNGFLWGEIWNWDEMKYWPWRSIENNPTHTRGIENKIAPAFPEELEIRIDEVATNRVEGEDFVEILVQNIPNETPLPPWNIKHNGTELFSGGGEMVKSDERITLFLKSEQTQEEPVRWRNITYSPSISTETVWESSSKNGLNKTSGTLELNIWTGTSWEQTADFLCWAHDELSEIEQKRLESHAQNWNGSCFKSDILPNESLARPLASIDTNSATDFFRHFNGSPQQKNMPQNNVPIPKILIQGGKKVYETSLNLTGLDGEKATTDPDGIHDIQSWKWKIGETSCGDYETDHWEWSATRKEIKTCDEESRNPNPGMIYFDFNAQEEFAATLTVEDFSGATETTTVKLTRDPFRIGGSGGNVFNAPLKKWIEKEFEKTITGEKHTKQIGNYAHGNDDFFDEFLAQFDATLIDPHTFQPIIPPQTELELFARNRMSLQTRARAEKNIGIVFLP